MIEGSQIMGIFHDKFEESIRKQWAVEPVTKLVLRRAAIKKKIELSEPVSYTHLDVYKRQV